LVPRKDTGNAGRSRAGWHPRGTASDEGNISPY
jgi:hypothetical protein